MAAAASRAVRVLARVRRFLLRFLGNAQGGQIDVRRPLGRFQHAGDGQGRLCQGAGLLHPELPGLQLCPERSILLLQLFLPELQGIDDVDQLFPAQMPQLTVCHGTIPP